MTKPVATINGKNVYSDKRMTGIMNTKVTFDDGSWCDVATGEVVSKGAGYINMGAPTSAGVSEKSVYGPKAFSAHTLDISNINADVEVSVIDGNQMVVTIDGPKSEIDGINVNQSGGTLSIQGTGGESGMRGANVVISGSGSFSIGGGNISISGGGVNISTGGGENETKLTVGVPKGSSVTVDEVNGNVTIGDIEGPLNASASTSNTVSAGKVKSAMLSVSSGAEIDVKEVTDTLVASASSGAEITVEDGDVTNMVAKVSSGGEVKFSGTATDAQLNASSGGDIEVKHVRNRPQQKSSSGGNINIGNW